MQLCHRQQVKVHCTFQRDHPLPPLFRSTKYEGEAVPSRKPLLKRRCTVFMYRMRPLPVVLRRMALTLQLSVGGTGCSSQHRQCQVVHLPACRS
jgi:hypothetical protein